MATESAGHNVHCYDTDGRVLGYFKEALIAIADCFTNKIPVLAIVSQLQLLSKDYAIIGDSIES